MKIHTQCLNDNVARERLGLFCQLQRSVYVLVLWGHDSNWGKPGLDLLDFILGSYTSSFKTLLIRV